MTPRAKTLGKWNRRNVIVEDALWNKAKALAEREDRPISSLVRLALKEYIERHA